MVCSRCQSEAPEGQQFCGKCGQPLTPPKAAEVRTAGEPGTYYCTRHPKVITRLRCGRCETPICPKCSVSTPAGMRCPTCARNKIAPRPAAVVREGGRFLSSIFYPFGPYRFWYAGAAVLFLLSIGSRLLMALFIPHNLAKYQQQMVNQTNNYREVSREGREIYKAINDYRAKTGKYPTDLRQLAPKFVAAADLHTVTDKSPDPAHISWTYYMPSSTTSPRAPLLETSVDFLVPSVTDKPSTTVQPIIINVDGSSPTPVYGDE